MYPGNADYLIAAKIAGYERWEIAEYPYPATREAIANAVAHRDFDSKETIFADRIEFYSPGDVLTGVTEEKMQRLESQSKLRNPVIVEVFRDLGGFIEKMGTGIQRMARAMEEHGLPRPRFEELRGEFRVTLIGPGDRFMEKRAVPEWMRGLNERQLKGLQRLRNVGRITNQEYRALNSIGRYTAQRDLADLVARRLVQQVGARGKGVYYVLADRLRR